MESMDRYDTFSRNLREIKGLPSSSDIPPLRDYPQKCDPRRARSYKHVQDIAESRKDQPLIDLPTDPYRVRRIVVPPTRLQRVLPKRVPNARDPRGVKACRRDSIRRKETLNWLPTLVENDGVPLEEETCAVLVVDASEWESKGVKSCYIDVVPHECNVQRALSEIEIQLAQIDDGLLMSAEEAERRMQPSGARAPQLDDSDAASSNGTLELTDSDVQECDSEGEVVPGRARQSRTPAPGFEAVEDRPMLEVGEGPDVSALRHGVSSPRPIDDDEDENRVIYDDDEEPPLPPVPKPDGAEVECVDLDADEVVVPKKEPGAPSARGTDDAHVCIDLDDDNDEEVIVPKQEPQPKPAPNSNDADIPYIDLELDDLPLDAGNVKQETQDAYTPYAKTVQREVLGVVTLDDSDEFEEDFLTLLGDSSIPKDKHVNNRPESEVDAAMTPTCSTLSIPPDAGTKDLLDNPSIVRSDEKNGEGQDHGESITEQTISNEIGEGQRNSDSDSASAFGSDLILDSVISRFRAAENNRDALAREQSVEGIGFGAAATETSYSADKADRSSDGDSEVPTTATRVETLAEVHVPATCDHEDEHSEIPDAPSENEEAAALLANSPTKARKWRRKKRKRLDTDADTGNAGAPIAETKRRKENDDHDVAVNDENKSDNGNAAVVERTPSPIFKKLSKKRKRSRWTPPSENVLQLSTVSTRAISKPSDRIRRTICPSNFYALGNFYVIGDLKKYFENYTATYNSIEFFCKNFQKLSVFEFLRVNEYVKSNIAFWQNRNNHWQQKNNNASIEDVTNKGPSNQLLAITDSPSTFRNNQVPSLHEVIQPGEHEAVIASTSATWNQQIVSIEEDMTNSTKSSWYAQESNAKDADGKAKLQRRHSLPMVIVPQQNLGAKRLRSCSEDNPIKLTLRRSQVNDDSWVASGDTSTLQNVTAQCTLSISNDIAQNVQNVISASQSLKANSVCRLNKKWSCIDKQVPELEIDDFANKPVTQKIPFDESKLSLTLQCRVKRRSTSIDSAIASDFDDYSNKRRKLTDFTKEYDSSMDNIFNDCSDRLLCSDYARESLEITELSPDSCIEFSRPSSVNICNLNSNNTTNTCENSGNGKSCNLEDSPKNCSTNAVALNQECLNLDESSTPCLDNDDHYLSNDNASSSSDSSFHEPEESSTIESHETKIQIDYNCNLQKDLISLDKPCRIVSNIDQEESNMIVHSRKQEKSNCSKAFTNDVNKLNKNFQLLFGESDIDEAERLVAAKSNKVRQTIETVQTSIESRLQPIEDNQSTGNADEETCAKKSQVLASSFTKSGSISTITNNEGQEHQTSNNKDSSSDTIFERSTNIENHLNSSKESAPSKTRSKYQNKMIINGISITPNVSNDSLKSVDQDDASLDVPSSQALLNNEEQIQVESGDALESETSLPIDKQSSVILNERVNSDILHCHINDNTSEQVFQNQSDEQKEDKHREKDGVLPESQETNHINSLLHQDQVLPEIDDEHALGETINVANDMAPEHFSCKDKKALKHKELEERNQDLQKTNNINTSTCLLIQDQVLPGTDDEHSLGNTINVASDVAPKHSPSKDELKQEHQGRNEGLLGNQETNNVNTSTSLFHQDQILPETVNLEEGFEEGDFEFLPTIQGIKTSTESDDEYDIHSDCDELDDQINVNYSKDINIQKANESLISNENADVSNCEMNSERICQSSRIEDKQVLVISQDQNLHSLQNSPLYTGNVAKSNSTSVGEEDDDIIIEYENISDRSLPKDIKPDISNINRISSMQVSELSSMHISSLDMHQDTSLGCQSEIQKISIPSPLPCLHNNDFTIEQDQLQTDANTENINSLNQSRLEIPATDTDLIHPMADNPEVPAMETCASNGINNEILDANTSIGSPLAPELMIRSSKNITVDLNNLNILQKFNLTKEIIAPEDSNTDNSTTFENNIEEQILSNTLKILENEISKDSSEKDCDISTVMDTQNYSDKDVEASTLPITIEFKMPTNKTQSVDDLLKALNVNVDNEVDIITPDLMDKISTKQASSGVIKVKNLNDMLQKPPTKENAFSNQNVSSNQSVSPKQNVSSGNPSPDVAQSNQQSINHSVENLQSQPNMPVNVFPSNDTVPNAYVIQPTPYTYLVNQPLPSGPLQPLMNMCNIVPVPVPVMNNIGQPMPVQNTSPLNQAAVQENPPTLPKMVLASSMFPGMFDSHPTSSFCSKTVFTLQLPPLPNIILPPPYTILPTHDQETISKKIQAYKWALLEKLIKTLNELENMHVDIIKRNLEILFWAQTLTEETWYFQERLLIVAQCVGSLQKLTTDKSYSSIIEAIVGSIYNRVRDLNLLKKLVGIFLKLKERGIFKSFAADQQPLTLELGAELNQSAIGMSSGQKEVLKYQVKIYQEIFKINNSSLQSNRISLPSNKAKKQVAVQRSSPIAIQQNIVTTTVSSPVTETPNSSLQDLVMQEKSGREKPCLSVQQGSKANKCDNISMSCIKCGMKSKILCSRCKIATYCSRDCQMKHWEVEHSANCNSVKT